MDDGTRISEFWTFMEQAMVAATATDGGRTVLSLVWQTWSHGHMVTWSRSCRMLVEADPHLAEAVSAAHTITSIFVRAFLASLASLEQRGHLSRLWSAIDSAVRGVMLAASGRSTAHLAVHGAAAGGSLSGGSLSGTSLSQSKKV